MVASESAKKTIQTIFTNKEFQMTVRTWTIEQFKIFLDQELFPSMNLAIRDALLSESGNRMLDPDNIVVRTTSGDAVHGGSTCTIVIDRTNADLTHDIICGNVGDSTGYIFYYGADGALTQDPVPITTNHSAGQSSEEYIRIRDLDPVKYPMKLLIVYEISSQYRKYLCPEVFNPDGTKVEKYVTNPWGNKLTPKNVDYEPSSYAVTPRDVFTDECSIAMTRALGDFYICKYGFSNKPSINLIKIEPKTNVGLVIASDGIWDGNKAGEYCGLLAQKLVNGGLGNYLSHASVFDYGTNVSVEKFGARYYDDTSQVSWNVHDLHELGSKP